MNKCWKFQEDILILVWFRAKRLKICCNQWPSPWCWISIKFSNRGPLVTKIFSLSALNQTRIKISFWNFQHLFITCLCKFDKKILAIFQTACPPQPILAETLDASSDCICWDIKIWWGSRPIQITSWKEFPIALEKWRFGFFYQAKASVHLHNAHGLAHWINSELW